MSTGCSSLHFRSKLTEYTFAAQKRQNRSMTPKNDIYECLQRPLEDGWGPEEQLIGPFFKNIMMFYDVTTLWLRSG